MGYIITCALLPIAVLIFYICFKDKNNPEPAGQLIKAFFYGVLSTFLSLCLSVPFESLGLYSMGSSTLPGCIRTAFFGAAIPEEAAKFVMLWLLLRRNKYFDEKMDGIVYAVCVSLGFAALENIMYLAENSEEFVSIGIVRALFAVPGHFCFGVLMGYYYSLAKFYPNNSISNWVLALVAPIIAHGVYDSILFVINLGTAFSCILIIVFLVFCHKMWKHGSKRIKSHLESDKETNTEDTL